MPPDVPGMKLVTVSYSDENGLEVDWDGMNEYEAYAYLLFAAETVWEQVEGADD